MLSWSIEETEAVVDLRPIATGTGDPLIPGGSELIAYVDATLRSGNIAVTRAAVVDTLGPDAAATAASVIGNFEMMNRIADGVGMPVGPGSRRAMAAIIEQLGLDSFPHA
jgi:hypothetical protein